MIRSELEDFNSSLANRSSEFGVQNVVKIIFKDDTSSQSATATKTVSDAGTITSTVTKGTLSGNKVISGWISKDFSFNTTVNSENMANMGILNAASSLNNQAYAADELAKRYDNWGSDIVTGLTDIVKNMLGGNPAGTQFGGYNFSKELWKGTSKPSFNLDLIMINTTPEDKITENFTYLTKICYSANPHASTGFGEDTAMTPPKFLISGSIDVKIGEWFYATNLIITGVNLVISKQTISDGSPLFALANIGFKSFRGMGAADVEKWFVKKNTLKSLTILKTPDKGK